MKLKTYFVFLVVCLTLASLSATSFAAGKAGWPAHLRMLTGPNGGQWFTMGEPIAELLSKAVLPTTSRIGGGMDNITAINQKTGDLGFSLASFLSAAGSGEEDFPQIDTSNTTILANVYPQVLYFLLRKDFAEEHGITSVETLLQKKMPLRFASLKPGTASHFILKLLFKNGYNTSFEQLEKQGWVISFNNYAETADNFVDGDLDCFAYTAGTVVPLIKTMEEHTDVIILPVDVKALQTMSKKFNTGVYTIKPGAYQSVKRPVVTLGDYTCILVRGDLPEDLVFAMTKGLWDGRKKITAAVKDFGALAPETALPKGLPMHPGAEKFWKGLLKKK